MDYSTIRGLDFLGMSFIASLLLLPDGFLSGLVKLARGLLEESHGFAGPAMSRTVRRTFRLIFFVVAGIAALLAGGNVLRARTGPDPHGTLAQGMAGHTEKIPALDKEQVSCPTARPALQGSLASPSIRAEAPPSEQAASVVIDQSYRPRAGLLQAQFGRAPPFTFSR